MTTIISLLILLGAALAAVAGVINPLKGLVVLVMEYLKKVFQGPIQTTSLNNKRK